MTLALYRRRAFRKRVCTSTVLRRAFDKALTSCTRSRKIGSYLLPLAIGSPGNIRVSRLFPVITDGAKRRPLLGSDRGSSNHGNTLFSKRVIAEIRSPLRVRT